MYRLRVLIVEASLLDLVVLFAAAWHAGAWHSLGNRLLSYGEAAAGGDVCLLLALYVYAN